jgi:hypothetical protein
VGPGSAVVVVVVGDRAPIQKVLKPFAHAASKLQVPSLDLRMGFNSINWETVKSCLSTNSLQVSGSPGSFLFVCMQPVTMSAGASEVEVGVSVVVVVVGASVVAGSVSVVGGGVSVDDGGGLVVEGISVVAGSIVLVIGLPLSSI